MGPRGPAPPPAPPAAGAKRTALLVSISFKNKRRTIAFFDLPRQGSGQTIVRKTQNKNDWRFFFAQRVSIRCENRHFLRHLYIKCIILPRQARDKHREISKKEWRFVQVGYAFRNRTAATVRGQLLFFFFPICLSRACLGKSPLSNL